MTAASPKFVAPDEALVIIKQNPFGEVRKRWEYFHSDPGPQGFMLLVPENNTIKPHFHRSNQFQIFYPTEGARLQRFPIEEVTVHYSDAYSIYGPITTSTSELKFFTLRPLHDDNFIAYMPEERHKLIRRGKRNLHGAVGHALDVATSSTEPRIEILFEDLRDGLSVRVASVSAGGRITTLDPSTGGGQYHLILEGSAEVNGQVYGPRSLLWCDAGDSTITLAAGKDGLALLTAQFPIGSQQIH